MRAVFMRAFGPPEVLEYQAAHPAPSRKKGEVLVKVQCTSVNPIDWKTRKGEVPTLAVTLPQILGGDLAGVVEEADADSKFAVGDKVFGCNGQQAFWNKWGCYAELATAGEDTLVKIPAGVSMEDAAAVPLAGMTAWQALQPKMPLADKRVLMHAGAGGVGHLAIQIAKAQGAHVTTTCSTRNVDFVKSLGADVAVDYSKGEKFEDHGPYDIVVDSVGGSYEPRSLGALKRGGHYTNILNSGFVHEKGFLLGSILQSLYMLKGKTLGMLRCGPSYSFLIMAPTASKGLVQIADLMAAGKLKPDVHKVMPLQEAAAAHALAESGPLRGKLVLRCTPTPST